MSYATDYKKSKQNDDNEALTVNNILITYQLNRAHYYQENLSKLLLLSKYLFLRSFLNSENLKIL